MTYTITWETILVKDDKITDPLVAVNQCLADICNGMTTTFTVRDNKTGKIYSVDPGTQHENSKIIELKQEEKKHGTNTTSAAKKKRDTKAGKPGT